jgi:hypothetical protein
LGCADHRRTVILRCEDAPLLGLFAPHVYQDLVGIGDAEERRSRILAAVEGRCVGAATTTVHRCATAIAAQTSAASRPFGADTFCVGQLDHHSRRWRNISAAAPDTCATTKRCAM